jgi:hypothetical protein
MQPVPRCRRWLTGDDSESFVTLSYELVRHQNPFVLDTLCVGILVLLPILLVVIAYSGGALRVGCFLCNLVLLGELSEVFLCKPSFPGVF